MRALLWLDACPTHGWQVDGRLTAARDNIRLGAKPVWSVRILPQELGFQHLEICL
jgi:hypothetical protein